MFEFLSSPFGLVAVGLGVLAIAVLALCLWITALDRRMRGMADGLEAERRKVAEMQMVIGRRNNAARSYGSRRPAPAPGGAAPMTGQVPMPGATSAGMPAQGQAVPQGAHAATRVPRSAAVSAAATYNPAPTTAPRPAPAPGAGWTPNSIPMPTGNEVDAWVQGGAQKPFNMPDKKMSRRARREAERAFAARAAAELEARQARRAQEAAFAQRMPGAGIPGAGVPAPGYAPRQGYPASGAGYAGRHAR